ncbi:putative tyrosine-protein phosphatase [Amylocarpus encephaloides]|uniref:Tyrosine-protein phosphatase n=1 Tax=Amylocarpus encephaloides TaxID=45428 RepID=A0A9P7YFP5_9HELO|nr:putative tyrosine-protein phosphatase [Amylocarpus encephaloides]
MSQPVTLRESQPPFIQIDGLCNFRDIGDLPTTFPSLLTRSNVLYRGPDLGQITSEGEQQLRDLGIAVIFDIRSTPQIDRAGGVQEIEGIKRIWCPVFEDGEYTPEKAGLRYQQYSSEGTEGIVAAFEEILIHGAKPTFRPLLLYLASLPPPSSPAKAPAVMVHCTTGNNRSGVFIGILLAILGVSRNLIAVEYALSQDGLLASRDKAVERLMKNSKFVQAVGTGEQGRQRAERMLGAREESMSAMLEMVEDKWGSVERYLKEECGLGIEVVERVREVLRIEGQEGDSWVKI